MSPIHIPAAVSASTAASTVSVRTPASAPITISTPSTSTAKPADFQNGLPFANE